MRFFCFVLAIFFCSCVEVNSEDLDENDQEEECQSNLFGFDKTLPTETAKAVFVGANSSEFAKEITNCPSGILNLQMSGNYLFYFVFPSEWEDAYWDGQATWGDRQIDTEDGIGYELIPSWCPDGSFVWESSAGLPGSGDDASFSGKCRKAKEGEEWSTDGGADWCEVIEIEFFDGSDKSVGSGNLARCR
jgi:hypothetical protein